MPSKSLVNNLSITIDVKLNLFTRKAEDRRQKERSINKNFTSGYKAQF